MSISAQENVIRQVQNLLDKRQPAGFRLSIVPEAVRQDEDWWYVTVVPDPPSIGSYEYAGVLSEIEELIQNETGAKVLLVPTLAAD